MNVKKNLENRIKGWFPKEPNPWPIQQYTQPPPINQEATKSQSRSGRRISLLMALYAAVWAFFSFTFMLSLNNLYHSNSSFRIIWLIVGVSVGIIFSGSITFRQLLALEKKGENPTTVKTNMIAIGVLILLVVTISEVATSNLPSVIKSAMGYMLVASTPSAIVTRTVLMVSWEIQKRTRIYQDKDGLYISSNHGNLNIKNQKNSNQTLQLNK